MKLRSILSKLLGQNNSGSALRASRENPSTSLDCSEFEVDGWSTSLFVIKHLVPHVGVHPFPLQELMLMTGAVCRLQPSLIFEWGTNIGKSARIFHDIAAFYGIPSLVHSVDLPDDTEHIEHPGTGRGAMVIGMKGVELHQGDGLDTSLELWRQAGRPPGPLFFIDGDHSYASVRRELDGILAEIPDARILLHDTFMQSDAANYNIGPREAIEETLAKNPNHYKVVHSGLSLPGMTLLYPANAPAKANRHQQS